MWRRPILQIFNADGINILPKLNGIWLECSITDNAGKESDTAKIVCLGPPSRFGLPARGNKYSIYMGWEDEGPVLQGIYTFQKPSLTGSPEAGDLITLQFRAADFVDKLKASGSTHYDETSYGDLVTRIAAEVGLAASIDPTLAKIKLPYQLRWDQSPIGFLSEISASIGATIKPAGGKLVAMKRGGSTSSSGRVLDPILIKRRPRYGYNIEIEPRPEVGSVAAAWHDEKSGRRKWIKEQTGREGPIFTLPHPYKSEEEAKTAAKTETYERGHNSGSGHFDSPGLPRAFAEAEVIASGFGWPIDGKWKAECVEKTISVAGGFSTTVNVKAGTQKKGGKAAD